MNKKIIALLTFIAMFGMATTAHSMKRTAPDNNSEQPVLKKNVPEEPLCACECGKKYFTKKSLILHYKHVCTTNPHREILTCQYCPKSNFSTPQVLSKHEERCKSNQDRIIFPCAYCNRSHFNSDLTLRQHEKTCKKNPEAIQTKIEKIKQKSPEWSLPSFQEVLASVVNVPAPDEIYEESLNTPYENVYDSYPNVYGNAGEYYDPYHYAHNDFTTQTYTNIIYRQQNYNKPWPIAPKK